MNKGELMAAIREAAHKPGLSDDKVERAIRLAEGMMARELESTEQTAVTTLDDTDRADTETGIYTLPTGVLEVRRLVYGTQPPLVCVSMDQARQRGASQSVAYYAVLGTRIEVRGIPPAEAELELEYLGRLAALDADEDENALLTNHEGLYLHGALFHVYRELRNFDAAQGELDLFNDAVTKLNEQARRKQGAAVSAPAYDFGGGGGY